jgi:urease accessory protein UreE
MLCEQVLGNLEEESTLRGEIDFVDLTWFDCVQRALSRTTRGGTRIRVLLGIGQHLRHNDILVRTRHGVIAVNQLRSDVLVALPRSIEEMGELAVEFGNLHHPVQIYGAQLIALNDGPTRAVLSRHQVPHTLESRHFTPAAPSIAHLPRASTSLTITRVTAR